MTVANDPNHYRHHEQLTGQRHVTKRQHTPHFIAGLGDGNVHDHDLPQANSQHRHHMRATRPVKALIVHERNKNGNFNDEEFRQIQKIPQAADARQHYLQQDNVAEAKYPLPDNLGRSVVNDPWEISVLTLLGIIAVLLLLFYNLISSESEQQKQLRKRRMGRSDSALTRTKKKKTDEWSEDELPDHYHGPRADVHSILKQESDGYFFRRQQQSRQRKTSTGGQNNASVLLQPHPIAMSPVPDDRAVYHTHLPRTSSAGSSGLNIGNVLTVEGQQSQQQNYQSPIIASSTNPASYSPLSNKAAAVALARTNFSNNDLEVEELSDSSGLGLGLEGFDILGEDPDDEILSDLSPKQEKSLPGKLSPLSFPTSAAASKVRAPSLSLDPASVKLQDNSVQSPPPRGPRFMTRAISSTTDQSAAASPMQQPSTSLSSDGGDHFTIGPSAHYHHHQQALLSSSLNSAASTPSSDNSSTAFTSAESQWSVVSQSSPLRSHVPQQPLSKSDTCILPLPPGVTMGTSSSMLRRRERGDDCESMSQSSSTDSHSVFPLYDSRQNTGDDIKVVTGSAMIGNQQQQRLSPFDSAQFSTPRVTHVANKGRKVFQHDNRINEASAFSSLAPPPQMYDPSPRQNVRAPEGRSAVGLDCQYEKPQQQLPFVANPERDIAQRFQLMNSGNCQVPFMPNLDLDDDDSIKSKRAPRSVAIDELRLFRMESGIIGLDGSRWSSSEMAPTDNALDLGGCIGHGDGYKLNRDSRDVVDRDGNGGNKDGVAWEVKSPVIKRLDQQVLQEQSERYSKDRLINKHDVKLEACHTDETTSGETEGGNGIIHKRKNLTAWTDASSSLTSPILFSELKMKAVIGGGGFGQVWEASWLGTPVAVKVLSGSAQTDNVSKAILQEFAAEINMVSGMRHPNICLYIGACLEPPNRAIVTELAANGSLWDALRQHLSAPYIASDGQDSGSWPAVLYGRDKTPAFTSYASHDHWYTQSVKLNEAKYLPPLGTWPWILVKRVASGAARGMNYLHCGSPPVLHRDLKSANLLLDESYNAKVADFGLSRLKAQERSMTGNCGTVQWMAPEILANESYAEPADVYSYGIILWELLSRECPYEGMSPIQCALAVLNKNSRPEIPTWCPPPFAALIRSCLEKNPSSRPTFSQILSALDAMP